MEVRIERKWKKPDYTIGRLFINGEYVCNTLEDTDRGLYQGMSQADVLKVKVKGATAIPRGTYNVIYTYSPKYKRNMPLVENVTGFSGIRIHSGNTANDTEGCILCGENKQVGKVLNSRVWTEKVTERMKEAWNKREKVTLKIQ